MSETDTRYGKYGKNIENLREDERFHGQTTKTGMLTTPIMLGENIDYDDPTIDDDTVVDNSPAKSSKIMNRLPPELDRIRFRKDYEGSKDPRVLRWIVSDSVQRQLPSNLRRLDPRSSAVQSWYKSMDRLPVPLKKIDEDQEYDVSSYSKIPENFNLVIIPIIQDLKEKLTKLGFRSETMNYISIIMAQLIIKCLGKSNIGNIREDKREDCIKKVPERINLYYNEVFLPLYNKYGKFVPGRGPLLYEDHPEKNLGVVPSIIFDFLQDLSLLNPKSLRYKLKWNLKFDTNTIYVEPKEKAYNFQGNYIDPFTFDELITILINKSATLEQDRSIPQQTFKPLTTTDELEGQHVEIGGKTRKLKRKSSKRKSSKRKSSKRESSKKRKSSKKRD